MCVRVGKEGLVEAPDPNYTSLVAPTRMPARKCTKALQPGDRVSAAAYSWGAAFAREKGDKGGRNDEVRVEGTVVEAQGNKWVCDFGDEDNIAWNRSELRFVSRSGEGDPARGTKRSRPAPREDSSDEEEQQAEAEADATHGCSDSSDAEDLEEQPVGRAGRPNHAMPGAGLVAGAQWQRDDTYAVDERAKHGFNTKHPPAIVNMRGGFENAALFDCALHFFPMNYLEAMAAEMTAVGRAKADEGLRRYAGWIVTKEDLLQWIGVWVYMLAFPQLASTRRSYFQPPMGGYGPGHNLQATLLQGGRGSRGLGWFEAMMSCFSLPQWKNSSQTGTENGGNVERSAKYDKEDPFRPTRMFWDHLRTAFYFAMVASWLICLDESMVRWTGRGMPGLMVILRKPTPIGLELHTLCCALCGVLVWFEVYEGKDAMAKKPFCDKYPKSIALTLRMLKPFFGSVRALCCTVCLHKPPSPSSAPHLRPPRRSLPTGPCADRRLLVRQCCVHPGVV